MSRETIVFKRKHLSSAETEEFFRINQLKIPQTTQATEPNQPIIQQCNSEILSDIETPAKSRMADSIIKEFEFENSANNGSSKRQIRPTINMINEALTEKFKSKTKNEDEILLVIMIITFILNICLHLGYMQSIQHTYKKNIGLIFELITISSINIKLQLRIRKLDEDEFHINIVIHLLSGPIQFIMNIIYFFQFQQIFWLSIVLKSLKLFGTNFLKQILSDIYNTFVSCLPIIFASVVVYFVFAYLCTILYCEVNKHYFKNIATSAFTLLQILTLDGWGAITKQLVPDIGVSVIILIFLFITILAMFFWFLIQAFQIDVMILDELVKQGKVDIDQQIPTYQSENLLSKRHYQIIFGKYYTRIVLMIWIIQLIYANLQNKLNSIDDFHYVYFHVLVSLLYFLHWIALLTLKDIEAFNSNYTKMQFSFHTLSGPIAFICSLYEVMTTQQIKYTPVLIMIKILTNSNIKDISYIALKVLSSSLSPYLLMLVLTIITMGIVQSSYHQYDSEDLLDTILIYLQTMTLDDWDGSLSKGFVYKGYYFAAFIIIIYVLICQFLLIPAFMAQACEIFQTILGVTFQPRLNQDVDLNLYQYSERVIENIVKRQCPRTQRYQQSKSLIYLFLKYQRALFYYEDKGNKKLLTQLYVFLTNQSNYQYPKFSTLNKDEQILLNKKIPPVITLQFKDQSISIDSNTFKFCAVP